MSRNGYGGADSNAEASNGASRKLLAELLLQLTECKQLCISSGVNAVNTNDTADCQSPLQKARLNSSSILTCTKRPKIEDSRDATVFHAVSPISTLEAFSGPGMVVVIAATNRIQDIDEAILRRFESKIQIQLPSSAERSQLILRYLRNVQHQLSSEDLQLISDRTDGWTGSEIENLTRAAAMRPVRRAFPLKQSQCNIIGKDYENQPNILAQQKLQETLAASVSKPITIDSITMQDFSKFVCFSNYQS